MLDWRSRCVLGWHVSDNRKERNARLVFEKAAAASGRLPSIVVSDGYRAYASVFKEHCVEHVVSPAFRMNALIERVNREVKERLKYIKCNV